MGDESSQQAAKGDCCKESPGGPPLTSSAVSLGARHPLSPLARDEIAAATAVVLREIDGENEDGCSGKVSFETVELVEPSRESVRAFDSGVGDGGFERTAFVVFFYEGRVGCHRWRISLKDAGSVLGKEFFPDARPMVQREESKRATEALREHADFIAGCSKRGITDMNLVHIAPWPAGFIDEADEERELCKGRHVAFVFVWAKMFEKDNYYAHPLEGLNALLDLKTGEVLRVMDTFEEAPVPVPQACHNYLPDLKPFPVRDHLKPIDIVQPEGVSFEFKDGRLHWHDFSLVIGFNVREGLTLHDIAFSNRPICYRASICEMVVPYGDPSSAHARKNVFDIGEIGFGKLTNPLKLGCDCLGTIQYLDCWLADTEGNPMKIENGICIHEEDHGMLWKHYDFKAQTVENRRARRLVISSISTVGNYDYASYWYLYLDGEIEFEMKATGVNNTCACVPGEGGKYGAELVEGVFAHIHQHIFCARLDMTVDGDGTRVVECDTVVDAMGSPENPYGNAFYVKETPIDVEGGRKRNVEAERYWKFVSGDAKNAMGKPTAYKLEARDARSSFHDPKGPAGSRMGFIFNPLWITPYDAKERYPAGDFVYNSAGGEGLPSFVEQGRSLIGSNPVAWYNFGLHHVPRPEDWPIQPVVRCGFKLTPTGFFDRNPVIDLAPSCNAASRHACVA